MREVITPKEQLMGETSVEVVKGIYEAFGRGDEAEGMPYGCLHQGREAVAQKVLGPLAQDIPDFAATPGAARPMGIRTSVALLEHGGLQV
jgi:hypothetical protein